MVYMAPTSSDGVGDVWVKVAEDGYDGSTWAVDTLIANKGKYDFTIPSVLADGDYLIRGEIVALHEANTAYNVNSARGAQFYMECVQVTVSGGGSTALPAGVAIPGAYTYSDPGVVFNLYGSFTSYTIPGPAVWDAAGSGSTTPASSSAAVVASSTVVASSSSAAAVVSSTQAAVATSADSVTIATSLLATTEAASSSVPAAIETPASSAPITSADPVASSTKNACSFNATKTTLKTVATPSASTSVPTVAKYGQCGGTGYTGSTTCAFGSICTVQNPYYHQCV